MKFCPKCHQPLNDKVIHVCGQTATGRVQPRPQDYLKDKDQDFLRRWMLAPKAR